MDYKKGYTLNRDSYYRYRYSSNHSTGFAETICWIFIIVVLIKVLW